MMKKVKIKILHFFYKIFKYCPNHGWFNPMEKYRMNTAYLDDSKNYSLGCKHCKQECFDYYDELWRDYNSSRL